MARQRFIWPQIWDDPALGVLEDGARLLYIGCFSLADDDGRMIGDPVYLKTQVFRYKPTTPDEVKEMRDHVAQACSNFIVYEVDSVEYIAFRNWGDFQKPKYPKPSRLPRPPRAPSRRKPSKPKEKSSGNDSGSDSRNGSPSDSGSDSSMGWVGLGSTKTPPTRTATKEAGNGQGSAAGYIPTLEDEIEAERLRLLALHKARA